MTTDKQTRKVAPMSDDKKMVRTGGPLTFTDEQKKMIRDIYAPGSNQSEFEALLSIACSRNLSPLTQQIFFMKRREQSNGQWVEKWSIQHSIVGLRVIADRTGLYDGQDPPVFEYEPEGRGKLRWCRVHVYRKGVSRPFVGLAFYDETVQMYNDRDAGTKRPNAMWTARPHRMLAIAAERDALRKAFPEDSDEDDSGVPVDEERPTYVMHTAPPRESLPVEPARPALRAAQQSILGEMDRLEKETIEAAGRADERALAAAAKAKPTQPSVQMPPPAPAPAPAEDTSATRRVEGNEGTRAPDMGWAETERATAPPTPPAPVAPPAAAPPASRTPPPDEVLPFPAGPWQNKKLSDIKRPAELVAMFEGFTKAAGLAKDQTTKDAKLDWANKVREWATYKGVTVT